MATRETTTRAQAKLSSEERTARFRIDTVTAGLVERYAPGLTLAKIERALGGEPASRWRGRCYQIACGMVAAPGLLPHGCEAVYGHWLGGAAPGSIFETRTRAVGFAQHGWVVHRALDLVIDATRWAFDRPEAPYLFVGRAARHEEYDEGGNRLRADLLRPAPSYGPIGPDPRGFVNEAVELSLSPACAAAVRALLADDDAAPLRIDTRRMFWLANLPLGLLGAHARELFGALRDAGHEATVPLDNWRRVMGT